MGVSIRGLELGGGQHPGMRGVYIQGGQGPASREDRGLHPGDGVCIQEGGGLHPRRGLHPGGADPLPIRYYTIQSMSRLYASYWNAFLLPILPILCLTTIWDIYPQ